MKMSDMKTVEQLVREDLGRTVILVRALMDNGHFFNGNVTGALSTIERKGNKTTLIISQKGKLVSAVMEVEWSVIFPTKAHPLYPA